MKISWTSAYFAVTSWRLSPYQCLPGPVSRKQLRLPSPRWHSWRQDALDRRRKSLFGLASMNWAIGKGCATGCSAVIAARAICIALWILPCNPTFHYLRIIRNAIYNQWVNAAIMALGLYVSLKAFWPSVFHGKVVCCQCTGCCRASLGRLGHSELIASMGNRGRQQ
jgi:hypothetical protein